ncbi:MAG: 5'/3'-nucleotidase SurE [Nitratireductor sp.]
MRILLTNDDGIHAHGLKVLERIARQLSDDIWIVAPEKDQSGVGRSITMNDPMRLREVSSKKFALTGTPTDCVIAGVKEIMDAPPDLILSGVNSGQNICDYVTYSGTVAGAMEGAILGIKSIALSQTYTFHNGEKDILWDTAEQHGVGVIQKLIEQDFPDRSLVNVNFPNCKSEEVVGSALTNQGINPHVLGMREQKDGRGLPYYWLSFSKEDDILLPGSDVLALRENKISITPLKVDKTDKDFYNSLNAVFS